MTNHPSKSASDSVFLASLFLLAFCLLVLPGCGRERKAVAVTVKPAPTVDPNYYTPTDPTPTPLPSPTATPSPGVLPPCTAPFTLTGTYINETPTVLVGQPLLFNLNASYCPGVTFQVQGRESEPRFTSVAEFTKTYAAPGFVTEIFVVKAFSPTNPAEVINQRQVAISFQVVATGPAPTCQITRVANTPVLHGNDPLTIRIDASVPVTYATLNGSAVAMGTAVQLLPVSVGTGQYTAQVQASANGQPFSCSASFQLPTCEHEIKNLDWPFFSPYIIVTSTTTFQGEVASATVNGTAVAPSPNAITVRSYLPYSRSMGTLTSSARSVSPTGDVAECSETVTP